MFSIFSVIFTLFKKDLSPKIIYEGLKKTSNTSVCEFILSLDAWRVPDSPHCWRKDQPLIFYHPLLDI